MAAVTAAAFVRFLNWVSCSFGHYSRADRLDATALRSGGRVPTPRRRASAGARCCRRDRRRPQRGIRKRDVRRRLAQGPHAQVGDAHPTGTQAAISSTAVLSRTPLASPSRQVMPSPCHNRTQCQSTSAAASVNPLSLCTVALMNAKPGVKAAKAAASTVVPLSTQPTRMAALPAYSRGPPEAASDRRCTIILVRNASSEFGHAA